MTSRRTCLADCVILFLGTYFVIVFTCLINLNFREIPVASLPREYSPLNGRMIEYDIVDQSPRPGESFEDSVVDSGDTHAAPGLFRRLSKIVRGVVSERSRPYQQSRDKKEKMLRRPKDWKDVLNLASASSEDHQQLIYLKENSPQRQLQQQQNRQQHERDRLPSQDWETARPHHVPVETLLREVQRLYPDLQNFQPVPIAEPSFADPGRRISSVHGNFTPIGRGAYIYSAFFDDRKAFDEGIAYVRLVALLSMQAADIGVYIHKKGEDGLNPIECTQYEMCENHSKRFGGYIYSCPVGVAEFAPASIDAKLSARASPGITDTSSYISSDVASKKSLSMSPPPPAAVSLSQYLSSNSTLSSSLNQSNNKTKNFTDKTKPFNENNFVVISFGLYGPRIKIPVLLTRPNSEKLQILDTRPHLQQNKTRTKVLPNGIILHDLYFNTIQGTSKPRPSSPYKLSFAVCVSPLFGFISPVKLIEFVELTQLLGAEHLYMYKHNIPDEISPVLEHYREKGVVTVLPWTLPKEVSRKDVWYHGQLLAINDCLYRSMPHHDLVAFNDLDEFIIPRGGNAENNGSTWHDTFSHLLDSKTCGFSFQSAFFGERFSLSETWRDFGKWGGGQQDEPFDYRRLIIASSVARTNILPQKRTKVMLCPWRVFEVGIHHISKQNREEWLPLPVKPASALLHHYRTCVDMDVSCQSWQRDTFVRDHFGLRLSKRVGQVMRRLARNG